MKANDILQDLDVIEAEDAVKKKPIKKNGILPSIPKVQSKGKFSSWNN